VRSLGVTDIADAADGHAALAMLEASPAPDVILCDIDLPGMDGVEFIRHVAERGLAGAVIIASALDTKVVQAVRAVSEGYGLQVLGAIEKPLRARRLAELLADYRPRPRPSEQASPDAADLTKEARTALDDGRITIHFQPEIDIGTGQVLTARSRPRWHDPARGWVPPDAFLPVLGGEGLLPELFALELASACAQVVDYGAQGLDLSIAVAVPGESLGVTDFADLAAATAQAHGADPSRITFWVDERSLTHAPSAALGVLTRLRVKGFGLSLGNFRGGGALNELLRALPFTEASIAPVLVTGAAGSPPRVRDLEETVEAGRALAPTVAGEGCDSEADLQLLLALGCDRVQGGYIQDPVPGEELPGWISRWDPERLEVGGAA
jgi:EAL domain-containing protein (putative c-di-GMP-specific phosphodiesterase class I)